jgi:anaphase-promoting complex subunit 8
VFSLHEAIECLKRALIGAHTHEIVINLKIAKLHDDLQEYVEAVAYHRRVVEVCIADREPVLGPFAPC